MKSELHIPLTAGHAIIPFPMTDDDYHLLTHSLELWHKRLTADGFPGFIECQSCKLQYPVSNVKNYECGCKRDPQKVCRNCNTRNTPSPNHEWCSQCEDLLRSQVAAAGKAEHQPAPGPYCGVCCKPFVPKPHESQTLCQSCSTL